MTVVCTVDHRKMLHYHSMENIILSLDTNKASDLNFKSTFTAYNSNSTQFLRNHRGSNSRLAAFYACAFHTFVIMTSPLLRVSI